MAVPGRQPWQLSADEWRALLAEGPGAILKQWQISREKIGWLQARLNFCIGEVAERLQGIPLAVKDNIAAPGWPVSAGSSMLVQAECPYGLLPMRAECLERLHFMGLETAFKTNLDEFAMGSFSAFSCAGAVRNPWDERYSPGGSSGGSAVAVATGVVPWALGSDTGGSVRLPASWCGITGLRPSYATVSRWGLIPFASSMDTVGFLARTVQECRELWRGARGSDGRDASCSLCAGEPVREDISAPLEYLSGLEVAVDSRAWREADPLIRQAFAETLAFLQDELGVRLREAVTPSWTEMAELYRDLSSAQAYSNLSRYDGKLYGPPVPLGGTAACRDYEEKRSALRSWALGPEVRRRLDYGESLLKGGQYMSCLERWRHFREGMDSFWREHTLLLAPASASAPRLVGQTVPLGVAELVDAPLLLASLGGSPSLSLPAVGRAWNAEGAASAAGVERRLPLGLAVTAAPGRDEWLLRWGELFQKQSSFHNLYPQLQAFCAQESRHV